MKATRYKYRYRTKNGKDSYNIDLWAANKDRVIENAELENVGYIVKEPKIIDTKTFDLPDLQFINAAQKNAFFDVFSRHEITIEDVMLYDYCIPTTKRKINIFHNDLCKMSVLLGFDFQADILGLDGRNLHNRASNQKAENYRDKLGI